MSDYNTCPEGLEKKNIDCPYDPAFLPTVTLSELYNHVYRSRPFLIDGLLRSGTYLFAGAPKTEMAESIHTDMKPNTLTMRLNIRAGTLMEKYCLGN